MSQRLVESLGTTEPLSEVFSDSALLAAMLRFEAALAGVESHLGVIPVVAAEAIARAAVPALFDASAIAREAHRSGTIAIPLVDALIARVAAADPTASTFVHWGATSQDVTDTALALCLARALPILQADHERLIEALRQLSNQHAKTIILGRTLLQPAPPITFGLKAPGWFAAVSRSGARMLDRAHVYCNWAAQPARSPHSARMVSPSRLSWRRSSNWKTPGPHRTHTATASRRSSPPVASTAARSPRSRAT